MDRSTLYNVADLKTGDIILFSGRCFVSRAIQFFTRSHWSHVGMIIIDPEHHTPLIYESAHDHGVQLTPFNERRRAFVGDMALRRLKCDLGPKAHYRLKLFRLHVKGRPFERSRLQMFAALLRWSWLPKQEDLSSIFCSELIAQCYQEMLLLSQDPPSNKYVPADFSVDRTLPMTRGKLGTQIIIKEYRA